MTEERLEAEKIIQTTFGQTLSWKYLLYARQNPVDNWNCETKILYGSADNITEYSIVDTFDSYFHCELKVMDNGEHWFHTREQLDFLSEWEKQNS